jgi:hypothetical protein
MTRFAFFAWAERQTAALRMRWLVLQADELLADGDALERETHRARQELDALTGGLPS